MSDTINLAVVKLSTSDITAEGINIKPGPLVIGDGTGEIISFTLKEPIPVEPSSFIFRDQLYLISKRNENWFECIAIEFTSI